MGEEEKQGKRAKKESGGRVVDERSMGEGKGHERRESAQGR